MISMLKIELDELEEYAYAELVEHIETGYKIDDLLHQIGNILKKEEGCIKHNGRLLSYLDDGTDLFKLLDDKNAKYLTSGYGHLEDPRRGGGMLESVATFQLKEDISNILVRLRSEILKFDSLNVYYQCVLLLLAFQVGVRGALGFKNMRLAMFRGHDQRASMELLDSKLARTHNLIRRCARLATLCRKGFMEYDSTETETEVDHSE